MTNFIFHLKVTCKIAQTPTIAHNFWATKVCAIRSSIVHTLVSRISVQARISVQGGILTKIKIRVQS